MKKLLKYIRGYIPEAIFGPILKLCEATLELIVPLIIAAIIDGGINKGDTGYAVRMSLWLLLLGAAGLAFSVTAQYFSAKAAVGFVTKMRSALFAHIGTLSYSEIDKLGPSTMITRMTSDSNQVQTGINLTLRLLLRSPFVVFGAMIMAFTIDSGTAGIFAITIGALSVVVFGIMLISIPLYKKVQSGVDGVVVKTRENLSGARVIRAFCKEDSEQADFRKRSNQLSSSQKFVGRISALMNPVTYIIINVAIVVLIYTGAIEVDSGDLTNGQVVALYNYMSQILVELIKLASLIITITKSVASAGRISSVFDIQSSINEGTEEQIPENSEYAVEFDGVSLVYGGAGDASLSDISFKVKRGETVGIIGGTGSGKSSLVNLIPRFYDATEGSVSLFGINVKNYTEDTLRDAIGIVPQTAVLFAGTIRDNMRFGNEDATDEQIWRALEIAQAADVVRDKGGLDARVEQGGKNLSGGQRQRLTIARAIVKSPDILILDDSASALDFATDAALRSAIRSMDGDTTVFIVSQRAAGVMYADRIIVLDDGEASGIGRHEELIKDNSVYREIYASQFKEEVQ
ncbi:MAG: ABC transporter ATP-binding protein [Clostridia bacterium]|nr:ABC transporter ATP-binding protein [Clostridia bacterium]